MAVLIFLRKRQSGGVSIKYGHHGRWLQLNHFALFARASVVGHLLYTRSRAFQDKHPVPHHMKAFRCLHTLIFYACICAWIMLCTVVRVLVHSDFSSLFPVTTWMQVAVDAEQVLCGSQTCYSFKHVVCHAAFLQIMDVGNGTVYPVQYNGLFWIGVFPVKSVLSAFKNLLALTKEFIDWSLWQIGTKMYHVNGPLSKKMLLRERNRKVRWLKTISRVPEKDWRFKHWLLLPKAGLPDARVSMGSGQGAFLSLPLVEANVPVTKYRLVGVGISPAIHASGFQKFSLQENTKLQHTVSALLRYWLCLVKESKSHILCVAQLGICMQLPVSCASLNRDLIIQLLYHCHSFTKKWMWWFYYQACVRCAIHKHPFHNTFAAVKCVCFCDDWQSHKVQPGIS